ncbi:MAG TPA: hypothetical protein VMY99_02615 [Nevskiaceae bacterium]|nr:hypothetical protein [Nevskiaceae bacterium]
MKRLRHLRICLLYIVVCSVVAGVVYAGSAQAAVQNPQSGSVGVEGTIPTVAPTQAATITTPTGGQVFTRLPITVNGICPKGLLVKIFANNVFVGSTTCENGSYSIQIDLFGGRNDLVARVFDALDQAGPDSNVVTVTFNDAQFNASGAPLLSLTSNYAQRGANPGEILAWPIILSGGTGPYALSVEWGDHKAADLISQRFTGTIDLKHIYDSAGVYTVTIKATDTNGLVAFLQVVAVANGAVTSSATTDNSAKPGAQKVSIMWAPAALSLLAIPISFWLGRRYELASLRKHLQ